MKNELVIYTDGASRGNPGPGGWAAIAFTDGHVREFAGSETRATNNQMELTAVLSVLSDSGTKEYKGTILVHTDSMYVINGITKWVYGWEKNGWITSTKTPVENKEIWQELLDCARHFGKRLLFTKVSGHAGDLYNERCDELAVSVALGKNSQLFDGSQKAYDVFLQTQESLMKKTTTKTSSKKSSTSQPAYSYVSMVDGIVHADKTWAECEKRVKGTKGAKYKKVFSKNEETDLIQDYTLASLL